MKLSKKSVYALKALACLGSPDTPPLIAIQEIAQRENIPKKFLEQVLLALNKAGIVQSNRGKTGGYALRGTPAGITLRDIVYDDERSRGSRERGARAGHSGRNLPASGTEPAQQEQAGADV
jgi:Rrf2 family protein